MSNGNHAPNPGWTNLDLLCARRAEEIASAATDQSRAKDLDKLATDALGVLGEQGVYALFLYLEAQGQNLAGSLAEDLVALLKELPMGVPPDAQWKAAVETIAQDLDTLLLAWELLGRTLTYTRYHARVKVAQEG
jgi:hypothetical protein